MFPLLACFCSSPKDGKLLVWNLMACHYGRVGIRVGQKETFKLPVAVRGSRTSVLELPINIITWEPGTG